MSAEIIQFVQRPKPRRELVDSTSPSRSAIGSDDLIMDHADTAEPCEDVLSGCDLRGESGRD